MPKPDPEETYEALPNEELHDELENRGLPVGGTKEERMSRLEANDRAAGFTVPSDANRCDATDRLEEGRVRCELAADHEGEHVWRNDLEEA